MPETRAIRNVEVFAPKVKIKFHTEDGAFEVETKDNPGGAEQSLVACQTYKDIGNPVGSFMIHLTDHGRYDRYLKPMDMVTISMSNHTPFAPSTGNLSFSRDQLTHATMIGFIDSVRRKRLIDPGSGKPNVFLEIKGSDFGKILAKHQIRYIPWLSGQFEGENMLNPIVAMFKSLLSGFLTGGNIDFLVANNLRKMLTQSVDLNIHFNKRIINLMNALSFRAQKNLGVIPYNMPLMSQEGSLFQILSNFANLPFNELWVDTINNPFRVIPADQSSPLSSPLTTEDLASARSAAAAYIASQSAVSDKKETEKNFGPGGSKISTAERYIDRDGSDNSNAYTMLFMRRTPFDAKDWAETPRINISNADIQEQDLGVSDNEAYNFFWVYPLLAVPGELQLKGMGSTPLLFSKQRQYDEKPGDDNAFPKSVNISQQSRTRPTSDTDANKHLNISRRNAVERFGFLPLEKQTRVWRWAQQEKMSSVVETSNLLTLTLANWYKHNTILKNGAMVIKGLPDLHVGNILVNVDAKEEYYVEGVTNNYVQYQSMTTTVNVTRGQPMKGQPGAIDWGNSYRDFCEKQPLKPGSQEKGLLDTLKKDGVIPG